MKIPSNVVRCLNCGGPIKHVPREPYACRDCGGHALPEPQPGYYWETVGGWLLDAETEDGGDTEDELAGLYSAIGSLADVFGEPVLAAHLAGSFSCYQADDIAEALFNHGQKDAAITFLEAHAKGDDEDEGDDHVGDDFDGYEYLTKGPDVEPEAERPALEVVTTEELIELLNL